jgi:exoribonuclease-2
LPAEPDAIALNRFLTELRSKDPKNFADISLSVIKLLGAGEYAVAAPEQDIATRYKSGHFGLAVNDYTHATAPNRRLIDLIVQRLVKATLSGAPEPYPLQDLQAIATRCNEQARNAAKVERQVRKAATALLLAARIGERFNGVVTGASAKGTWIRVDHPVAEGKVVRGAEGLDVGDCVKVELVGVDPARGFIDFART